ncbi:MAG TPA: hypothetical protein VMU47_04320 [Caldimonas sp.]|nr:hypothetical protein [Caldimonas sp.]
MATTAVISLRSTQAAPSSGYRPAFVAAWAICVAFYFMEYVARSAPTVMLPELSHAFGLSAVGLGSLVGLYDDSYAIFAMLAGAAPLTTEVFDKAGLVYPAAIVVAMILALFLKETGSAAQRER